MVRAGDGEDFVAMRGRGEDDEAGSADDARRRKRATYFYVVLSTSSKARPITRQSSNTPSAYAFFNCSRVDSCTNFEAMRDKVSLRRSRCSGSGQTCEPAQREPEPLYVQELPVRTNPFAISTVPSVFLK